MSKNKNEIVLTSDREIKLFDMAMQLRVTEQGAYVNIPSRVIDGILTTYKYIRKKKGKFTIKDAVEINHAINTKYGTIKEYIEKQNEKDNLTDELLKIINNENNQKSHSVKE